MAEKPGSVIWVRYTWRLLDLDVNVPAPVGYRCRPAFRDEWDAVIQVVLSAYAADPAWGGLLDGIKIRMTKRIQATIDTPDSQYLVAECEGRIVAVSGIAKTHWTGQNLLTGICVTPEHQRKGLGKYLLALSLLRLREMGLGTARVYTEAGSLADRKIYSLFGSRREKGVDYPGLQPPPEGAERSS